MQITINNCKKFTVSYVATTGSLTVDFESTNDNALALLSSGGNFRARFFLRRMFQPTQAGEQQLVAEQRGAQAAQAYTEKLGAVIGEGVKIAHGIFTVTELSEGAANAISAPRADGTRVIMSSLTRDAIVSQDTIDETLQNTLLAEAKSVFKQGLASQRYQIAQAVYQPVQVGAQPAQQPQNPLQGLTGALPEQQPIGAANQANGPINYQNNGGYQGGQPGGPNAPVQQQAPQF